MIGKRCLLKNVALKKRAKSKRSLKLDESSVILPDMPDISPVDKGNVAVETGPDLSIGCDLRCLYTDQSSTSLSSQDITVNDTFTLPSISFEDMIPDMIQNADENVAYDLRNNDWEQSTYIFKTKKKLKSY